MKSLNKMLNKKERRARRVIKAAKTLSNTSYRSNKKSLVIKTFYWNIGGIANPNSQLTWIDFCFVHKPDVVLVSKPKVSSKNMPF